MTAYLELAASWLFSNAKGRDAKLFHTRNAFAQCREPTIRVESTDCGETLGPDYMAEGDGKMPELRWETVEGVAQWLIMIEDSDAPLPTPICHGIYLGIAKDKLSISNADLKRVDDKTTRLKGDFHYGASMRGSVYIPPRPLLNHGIHRYFFEVIALKEPLDQAFVSSKPSRDRVAEAIDGKVLAWGQWKGQCERRWD